MDALLKPLWNPRIDLLAALGGANMALAVIEQTIGVECRHI